MIRRTPSLLTLPALLVACTSLVPEKNIIHIEATVIDPDYLVTASFTNDGYNEQGILIKIQSPQELKDEIVAIPISATFGPKETLKGNYDLFELDEGSVIEFDVRKNQIQDDGLSGHRQILSDKLKKIEVLNKSVDTTRISARRNSNTLDTLNLNPTFEL